MIHYHRSSMLNYQGNEYSAPASGNWKSQNYDVMLVNPKYQVLAGSSPVPFPRPIPADRCFISFHSSHKGFPAIFLICATRPDQAIKTLYSLCKCYVTKTQSVSRYPIDKQFNQLSLGRFRQSTDRPHARQPIPNSEEIVQRTKTPLKFELNRSLI